MPQFEVQGDVAADGGGGVEREPPLPGRGRLVEQEHGAGGRRGELAQAGEIGEQEASGGAVGAEGRQAVEDDEAGLGAMDHVEQEGDGVVELLRAGDEEAVEGDAAAVEVVGVGGVGEVDESGMPAPGERGVGEALGGGDALRGDGGLA